MTRYSRPVHPGVRAADLGWCGVPARRFTHGFHGETMVYRFFGDYDMLLYVGITDSPVARWEKHRRTKWWPFIRRMETEWVDSRDEAFGRERQAIRTERPLFNKQGVPAEERWAA